MSPTLEKTFGHVSLESSEEFLIAESTCAVGSARPIRIQLSESVPSGETLTEVSIRNSENKLAAVVPVYAFVKGRLCAEPVELVFGGARYQLLRT